MFHKLTAYLSVYNLFLTQWLKSIFSIFNIINCPYYSLCSNFVEYESFIESNSTDIFALFERNLDDSIDCSNFWVRGYLPLIQKESITHKHGLAVYAKEGLPFVIVCIGVSTPPLPCQAPLKSASCPSAPFSIKLSLPLYWFFVKPLPLKVGFFS